MTEESEDFPDSELAEGVAVPANSKIVHVHNGTTTKMALAWAGVATAVLLGMVGYWASDSDRENDAAAERDRAIIAGMGEVRERLVAVETRLAAVERAVEGE